jgi:hypothetical protein
MTANPRESSQSAIVRLVRVRLRCGWHLALIRKWFSESWGMPQLQ